MTELLYQTDSYIREFTARVTQCDEVNRSLVFDRTAFYPGGGGQPADAGVLIWEGETIPLDRVKKQDNEVFHYIAPEFILPATGSTITGLVDWEKRYQLMRTHTAMHILCGVVFRDYGALVTGGDMEPCHGRMDFEFESLTKDLVTLIEEAVNREVQAARPVRVRLLPREDALKIPDLIRTKINLVPTEIALIRTVELVGLDLQADGGTHVASTTEVGRMRIVDYKSKGRINKRIYIELE